jgi:hypothetical protein
MVGYRDKNDGRYYVPVTVYSAYYNRYARFNFLIDTGATRTQLSWIDADYFGLLIRTLPKDMLFVGVGGGVMGYLLQECTLIFNSNIGRHDIPVGDLSVSDFQTIDGKRCPALPSMLWIDVLDKFDLLFETNRVFLRKKINNISHKG